MMNIVVIAVVMVAYKKIVMSSDWYEDKGEYFYNIFSKIVMLIAMLVILLIGLYCGAYAEILFVIVSVSIVLVIAIRKEFVGFRRWLDEKFGWLY